MELLSVLALVLLTLVGFSSGSVLAAGEKKVAPGLLDLLLVVALWVLVFSLRDDLGKWGAIGAGLLAGGAVGATLSALRPGRPDPYAKLGHLDEPVVQEETGFLAAWKRFAMKMGNFQGRMIMAFFYFVVVTPFALISRLSRDPYHNLRRGTSSFWLERPATVAHLDTARTQF